MGLSPNSENTKSLQRENWRVNYGILEKWYERKIVCDALDPKHHGLWYHPWYSMATLPGTVTGIKNQIGKNPWARPQALFATPSGPWDLRQSGQAFLLSHPFVPPDKGSPGPVALPWQERPTLLRLCCYGAKCCRATWLQSYCTDVLKDMWDYSGTKGIHTIVL